MKIIYFLQNHSINLPEIWSDCSIYVCIFLIFCIIGIMLVDGILKKHELIEASDKKNSLVHLLSIELEQVSLENSHLKEAFKAYKEDTQKEIERIKSQLPKCNLDGTFAVTTGKGHGKKKEVKQAEIDWKKATKEELLAEAKRRYPVGTKIESMSLKNSIHTVTWENIIHGGKNEPHICYDAILCGATNNMNSRWMDCILYENGIWAKIVK